MADHNYVEGICSVCGASDGSVAEPEVLATFEFGENTTNLVADNNGYYGKDGSKITEEFYTVDNYTLALTSCTNVYASGYDATGNATLKLGTASKVGSFTFTVSEDVKSVEIVVTAYKKNTSKYQITSGGVVVKEATVSGNSDNNSVEYTTIKIDTSVNKTFTFSTVSGGVRMLVASIIFIG